jgi:hypothetical protein
LTAIPTFPPPRRPRDEYFPKPSTSQGWAKTNCRNGPNQLAKCNILSLNQYGEKLLQALRLDSPKNVEYRLRLIRVLGALQKSDPSLYEEMMSFPNDLPDLRAKREPSNTKPEGVLTCHFVLRENGSLPSTY